ncbi:MAG: FecR domain-containing protein [Acidobacteriota bacterium]|nr:FecR domain-containing protein [Acidobacteriota bacterium]
MLAAAALLVCLPPAHAQSTSKAIAIKQVGSVAVVKDSSSYRTAIFLGSQVSPGQTIITGSDGYAVFQVQDGSTFEVFPDSQVTFRNTMSVGDLLNVVIGKIKVYIQHLPGIPNPNNVSTPTALISVRGTVFSVEVQDGDGTTRVAVEEGMVDVRNLRMGGKIVRLIPGQETTVDPYAPLIGLGGHRGMILERGLNATLDAIRTIMLQRQAGAGLPGGTAPAGGASGDKGKPTGGTTGTGSPTGGTTTPPGSGSPTGGSGTPPPPPGGGGE